MGKYDFTQDLIQANKSEREISEILTKKLGVTILKYNNDYRYDVLVRTKKNIEVKIEIKEDFYCERSGNVAVEYECRGKCSGIDRTEADIILYRIHEPGEKISHCIYKTNRLKQIIIDKKYSRIVSGGDEGSNTKNYLFTLQVFKENANMVF